jgi:hypothetical protein
MAAVFAPGRMPWPKHCFLRMDGNELRQIVDEAVLLRVREREQTVCNLACLTLLATYKTEYLQEEYIA